MKNLIKYLVIILILSSCEKFEDDFSEPMNIDTETLEPILFHGYHGMVNGTYTYKDNSITIERNQVKMILNRITDSGYNSHVIINYELSRGERMFNSNVYRYCLTDGDNSTRNEYIYHRSKDKYFAVVPDSVEVTENDLHNFGMFIIGYVVYR